MNSENVYVGKYEVKINKNIKALNKMKYGV